MHWHALLVIPCLWLVAGAMFRIWDDGSPCVSHWERYNGKAPLPSGISLEHVPSFVGWPPLLGLPGFLLRVTFPVFPMGGPHQGASIRGLAPPLYAVPGPVRVARRGGGAGAVHAVAVTR